MRQVTSLRSATEACTAVIAWSCLVPMGVVGLALCGPVLLVVSARRSLGSVVPFLGASPWWHQQVWFPDLVVCPGSGVVLLVGPPPYGGLRWPCLRIFGSVGGDANFEVPGGGPGGR
ncbi:hypothetical protein Taro_000084, partial [Colocasia esculenta]|nr:hypothetical protein [Colocasia esculenta]